MAIKIMQKMTDLKLPSKDVIGVTDELRKKVEEKTKALKNKEPYVGKLKGEDDEPENPIVGKTTGKGGWNQDPKAVINYNRYKIKHNEWEEKEIAKDRARASEYGEYQGDEKKLPLSRQDSADRREAEDAEKLEGGRLKKEIEQARADIEDAREAIKTNRKGYDYTPKSVSADKNTPEYKAYWENRSQKSKKKMADLIKSMQK